MNIIKKSLLGSTVAICVAILFSSCNKNEGWSVEGTVDGASNCKLAIEQNVSGAWVLLDSVDIDANGHFSYIAPEAAEYPDLYRLSLDNARLYFPIDSLDHVTVTTKAEDFGGRYQMSGSVAAENIARANNLIYHYIDSLDVPRALSDSNLKVQLFDLFRDGDDLMTPYYLIYRNIDGRPLFDIVNRDMDYRLLGAVATKFKINRPEDPRTKFLEQIYVQEQKRRHPTVTQLEANLTGAPGNIVSVDVNGKEQSLFDIIGKGKPVVLSFAVYGDNSAKPYTMVLNSIYEKYHDKGLQLYQVSFDNDETSWLEFGRNLPWISVWATAIKSGNPMVMYNVSSVPTTFIFDGEGNLIERVEDYTMLDASLSKLL